MRLMQRLWKQEEGQGLTEYALLLATIVIIVGIVLIIFSDKLKGLFNGMSLTAPAVS